MILAKALLHLSHNGDISLTGAGWGVFAYVLILLVGLALIGMAKR